MTYRNRECSIGAILVAAALFACPFIWGETGEGDAPGQGAGTDSSQSGVQAIPNSGTETGPSMDNQDKALARQVREAIDSDDSLSSVAQGISVTAAQGTVTLRGTVKTASEKSSADSRAESVAGSGRVSDEIIIKP